MIDKSIRQHYQDGNEVKKLKLLEMGEKLKEGFKEKYTSEGAINKTKVLKDLGKGVLTNQAKGFVAKKLGISSINPLLGLLSLFGIDPISWLTKKITQGGALQAFQTGFGSPQEGRELRQLEKRRANMLQRKEEGKSYSDKNLGIVTRAIAEAKGIDINNPNEMKNIDKDISNLYSKTITPQVIPEEPEIKSPFATTEDTIKNEISDLVESGSTSQDTIDKINELATKLPFEHEGSISTTDPTGGQNGTTIGPTVEETAAMENIITAPPKRTVTYTPPVRHHTGGGNGGGGGRGGGQAAADAAGGSAYSSPFLKGGRVDKALGGRVRDI